MDDDFGRQKAESPTASENWAPLSLGSSKVELMASSSVMLVTVRPSRRVLSALGHTPEWQPVVACHPACESYSRCRVLTLEISSTLLFLALIFLHCDKKSIT